MHDKWTKNKQKDNKWQMNKGWQMEIVRNLNTNGRLLEY